LLNKPFIKECTYFINILFSQSSRTIFNYCYKHPLNIILKGRYRQYTCIVGKYIIYLYQL